MAITTINSLAIPAGTVVSADLTYPLTGFSSTGIDDNATSTAITIDASENVNIGAVGTTTLTTLTGPFNGDVVKMDGSSGVSDRHLIFSNSSNSQQWDIDAEGGASSLGVLSFSTNSTERMRIDSSGNLLVGETSAGSSRFVAKKSVATAVYAAKIIDANTTAANCYGLNIDYSAAAPNGSANQFIYCEDSSTVRMQVNSNGGIYNYQAFDANLSDRRAKKDIVESGDYLEKLCSIPVKNFRYNEDEENSKLHLGVIAQEVEAVAPEFVNKASWEYNEQQMDSVFNTDLMFAMMKSIQELSTQVNELKAEVAALKGA
jgi:hypothetical protein